MNGDGRSGAYNNNVARDAYGFALHYFGSSDYKPINATNPFASPTLPLPGGAGGGQPLFNGNISAQTVNIKQLGQPMLYVYGYDQLNRIKRANAFTGLDSATNVWTPVATANYKENFTYDGNGNILKANRNGNAGIMDSLQYRYSYDANGHLANNKLNYVTDQANDIAYTTDIKNQPVSNYTYDAIGNLIHDTQAGIDSINWSVYGKIKKVAKGSNIISYSYDPGEQRVTKTVGGITTYYVSDGQGNTLALYDNAHSVTNWKEQHLYGSSRLGMWTPNVNLATGNAQTVYDTLGRKFFELNNHLGNVLATITDRRLQVASGSLVGHYEPDVSSAQSYFAFGMEEPGLTYNAGNYRYGFNGKEMDNSINGTAVDYDYGFRIYDARLGKFTSVDPLASSYPWYTPYQFAGNSPLMYVDVDGAEGLLSIFLPNAFSEENTTKLKNNLGVSKGGFWDKTIDFIAGAGDEAFKLNKPQTYYNTAVDHVTALGTNIGKIVTANNNGERAKATAQVLAPSLIEAEPTAVQVQKAVNGDMRAAGNIATDVSVAVVMHRMGDSNVQSANAAEKTAPTNVQRPTFRESENQLTPSNTNIQESFKNGRTVTYGQRGSVRPEGFDPLNKTSFEVKNYDVTTKRGIGNLINNVIKQVRRRLSNLPKGSKQNVIIDVRGQEVSQSTLNKINNRISTQVGSQNVNITFKTSN